MMWSATINTGNHYNKVLVVLEFYIIIRNISNVSLKNCNVLLFELFLVNLLPENDIGKIVILVGITNIVWPLWYSPNVNDHKLIWFLNFLVQANF